MQRNGKIQSDMGGTQKVSTTAIMVDATHFAKEETCGVHSSRRKHCPVLPPWKQASREHADKTPTDGDMEDTRCQLL